MVENILIPDPTAPEWLPDNGIRFRRLPPVKLDPEPPDVSLHELPLCVQGRVKVETFLRGLESAGLSLRLDPASGQVVIDEKPSPG
jgi:hypothetical protein